MKQVLSGRPPRSAALDPFAGDVSHCVKCGTCSAVCPSYRYERDESFSARGRMALIKAVLEERLIVSDAYRDRLATCTACLACEASCPANIPVTTIIQAAKEEARERTGAGITDRMLAGIVKHPALFRALAGLAPAVLHQSRKRKEGARSGKREMKTAGTRGRIAFFPGCAVEYFQQDIGSAVLSVLRKLGYDAFIPEGLRCCGRPLLSMGDRKSAEEVAARNAQAFSAADADAIVTACASCGLTFKKEYPTLLRPGVKRPVVLDIHELLHQQLGNAHVQPLSGRITIHDPCHLGRGQGLSQTVRAVLRSIRGLTFSEMRDADQCCGFGGVMRMTHRALSDGIADEKVERIIETGAFTVVTACPGCRMQIASALARREIDVDVVHPIQLLDRALVSVDAVNETAEPEFRNMSTKEQRA